MSAHYQWVTLPTRKGPDEKLWKQPSAYDDPEVWQLTHIGQISIHYVASTDILSVWQDQISKKVFYGKWRDYDNFADFAILREETKYTGFDKNTRQELWEIHPGKVEQFCLYVMGWKPNVWTYEPKLREELCAAVREAIKLSPSTL